MLIFKESPPIMNDERYVVGQVKAKYNGEDQLFDVLDDGTVILPNGETTKIDDSILQTLKAQYNRAKNPVNEGATAFVPNVGKRETKAYETLKKTEETAKQTQKTNDAILHQVKIMNHNQRRNIILALVVVFVFLTVAALIVLSNFQQLKAFVTGEYNIAVVNTEISKGDTIEDAEISFVTISEEEYESLCGSHIVGDDGSIIQDKPVFFVDRAREIVNKFATDDIQAGDIVMLSSVSAQQSSEDMYVVETEDSEGNRQTQTIDGAALESDTRIEYFARVTTSSGDVYEVPLSSILLRNKTVEDILNEQGASILAGN